MNRLLLLSFFLGFVPCIIFAKSDSGWCKDYVSAYCSIPVFKRYCPVKCDGYVPVNPSDGNWGQWSDWGQCNVNCGKGQKTRTRLCNNPSPSSTGRYCQGTNTDTMECNGSGCPIDGQWGAWTYHACAVTCGPLAYRIASARCDNPSPQHGGKMCPGGESYDPYIKTKMEANSVACGYNNPCPVDGQLTNWGDWSDCSKTCGEAGTQKRTRQCINRAHGGQDCNGALEETKTCIPVVCPVDGGYTDFTDWSNCSTVDPRDCGRGYRYKTRCCTNPVPGFLGKDCSVLGEPIKIEVCYKGRCPLDGHWTPWSAYEPCNPTCGEGTQARRRKCEYPAPRWDGDTCDGKGDTTETRKCNEGWKHACPADGTWTEWTEWNDGDCTAYCKKFRTRCCLGIVGSGKACEGLSFEEADCDPGNGKCARL